MATNKVVYGDRTLIDLTNDSVSPGSLLEGETAHDRSGNPITGTAKQGHMILDATGTAVTQRTKLQFGKSVITDDPTNDATKINVNNAIRKTYAQYQALPSEEKTDGSVYYIPDYPGGGGIDLSAIVNAIYPIGSILMSADSTNPSERFPNTTWIAWGSGQVPVGVNASDTDFNTVEKTGGSKTKSFTPEGTVSTPTFTGTASDFTPSGTVSTPTFTGTAASLTHSGGAVGNHTLTTNEIPAHNHPYISDSNGVGILYSSSGTNGIANTAFYLGSTNMNQKIVTVTNSYAKISNEYGTKNRGGGGSHNHGFTNPNAHSYTPAGSVSQPTFTGTKGSITPSGTVSQPSFTGTESNINSLQPYITCYMWKRTA